MVVLEPGGARLFHVADGSEVIRPAKEVTDDMGAAEKGGYAHFMLKEIHEQPETARELLHLLEASEYLPRMVAKLRAAERLFLVGSGSSYHACLLGSTFWSRMAGGSRSRCCRTSSSSSTAQALRPGDVALYVSQSGETKDVLNAINFATPKGVRPARPRQRPRLDDDPQGRGLPAARVRLGDLGAGDQDVHEPGDRADRAGGGRRRPADRGARRRARVDRARDRQDRRRR